jgi:predicted MFS family arabinose efflux permease
MALRRNRDFVLLQTGQLLSSLGSSLSGVAYPLVVLSLTHSPPKAGLVAFARALPSPLFGLPAGALADRVDRRVVMLAADVGRAAALAALALVVAFDPVYWPIPLLAFAEGTGDAFFGASAPGATRAVVPIEALPAAVSVQQGRSAAVGVAGPPLGGVLFGVGRALPFLADAVSYAFSFAALLAMLTPFQQPRERRRMRLRAQLAEGFRFLWSQPFLRATAFLYAVGNFTIPAYLFVLVVVGRRHALTGGEIGVLLAVFSAFVFLGSLLSPAVSNRLSVRTIVLLELYTGLGALVYVAWPNVYVLTAGLLPQAIVLPITDSVVIGRRIAMTPDRLLGRVEAVRTTLARTAQPLGPLVAGLLLGAVSGRATVAVLGVLTAGLAVCGTASRALRSPPALAEVAS